MSSSALVTGATGFIGQHLCQQLLEQHWDVTVLRRPTSTLGILAGLPLRHKLGDITNFDSVLGAFDQRYDAVFHVAADTSVWRGNDRRQQRINIDGTRHVIKAAQRSGSARLVATSSVSVYGFPDTHPITESTPRDTDAYWINYFRTKAAAEDLVLQADLDSIVLSPAHVMGPLDQNNWARMIKMVAAERLPGIPPGAGSFADVRHVARAHITAARVAQQGEKYLLGGENHRFETVVRLISKQLGKPHQLKVMPAALLKTLARLKQLLSHFTRREPDLTPEGVAIVCGNEEVDSSKAINQLNYQITPLDDLLVDSINWLRENRHL